MKKIKYVLFLVVALFVIVAPVKAATITKSTYDGNIKLEGNGEGQIQIVLFDQNNEPMYMTTVMATDNKFAITLPKIAALSNGEYKVKVADYDGKNVDSEVVKVEIKNPKTGDNILYKILLGAGSVITLVGATIYLKRS